MLRDDVLNTCVNLDNIDQADQAQIDAVDHMLSQVDDANHVCDTVDLAAERFGCDLQQRNLRNYQKYVQRGYEPWTPNKEKFQGEAETA